MGFTLTKTRKVEATQRRKGASNKMMAMGMGNLRSEIFIGGDRH
jgi:hypothetical protein